METLLACGSILLILLVLVDGFEAIILPRRVTRPYRYTRLFYRNTWNLWRAAARSIAPGKRRETFLSVFGPLSLLGLFFSWVVGLIVGFAVLHWSLAIPFHMPEKEPTLASYLYMSGTTFFTLGFGDVTPLSPLGRFLTVLESGMGFAFLASVISYMPVLYQSFSRREVAISLLDARAGSPPSAAQLLVRIARARNPAALGPFLAEWERWAAEVLESHLSYPVLSFYRSQHDNQSWLAALTAILDTCAVLISGVREIDTYQAQLTFAMARHVVVDLALVFQLPPRTSEPDRLSGADREKLSTLLQEAGLEVRKGTAVELKLTELRGMYEPFVHALSRHFLLALPPVVRDQPAVDNWQTSAWTRRAPGFNSLPVQDTDDHFN